MHAPCEVGGEVAEHHPEAVVQRHRDADPVALGVAEHRADEVAVVEDVVVGERRALGEAGGAARVLDVDRVVEVELVAVARRASPRGAGARGELLPVGRVEEDRALERRAARGRTCSTISTKSESLSSLGGDDPAAARLASAYSSSLTPVGGIDVDEDHARPWRSRTASAPTRRGSGSRRRRGRPCAGRPRASRRRAGRPPRRTRAYV